MWFQGLCDISPALISCRVWAGLGQLCQLTYLPGFGEVRWGCFRSRTRWGEEEMGWVMLSDAAQWHTGLSCSMQCPC